MGWLQHERLLSDIVNKINGARNKKNPADTANDYFEALNSLYKSYYDYRKEHGRLTSYEKTKGYQDKNSFRELVFQGLNSANKIELLNLPAVFELAHFEPLIMSDEILGLMKYNPKNIDQDTRNEASVNHAEFKQAYAEYLRKKNDSHAIGKALGKLCNLLYVVRCNLQHCGKTPNGPDLDKAERDKLVCSKVLPIIDGLFDILFCKPDNRLAVYGTLMQGKENHSIIGGIKGKWNKGHVSGVTDIVNGYPMLSWIMNTKTVDVEVLDSIQMKNNFSAIDRFEGDTYQRFWIPIFCEGKWIVGNIYGKNPTSPL